MKRPIISLVAFLLLSIMCGQAGLATAIPSLTDRNSEPSWYAPPLNDTFPTLIPAPIIVPRAPSYAVGPKSLIVIAVEFENQVHTKAIQEIEQLIFTDVNHYFQEVSYGKASITGKVVGWYNMNRTVGAYGRDGLAIDDPNGDGSPDSWQLIQDAINVADRDVDFNQYNYVMVIHAGFGQETSQNPNDIWSCAYIWGLWFKTIDGQAYSHGTIVPELEDRGATAMGVIAHEFGHEIGLPDLYDPYGQNDYVGKFDLMCRGIWNGEPAGSSPSHPTSWSKIQLGWIEPNQVKTIEKGARANVTLSPQEKQGGTLALRVSITERQYYLVEIRQKIGYDFALPSVGVLISYIDESYGGAGKVRVVDANPLTMTTDDAPYQVGQSFSDIENQIAISILSTSSQNYQLYVDRGTPQSDLAISYSGMDPQFARKGQVVMFTFVLKNQGTLAARDFKVNTLIDGTIVNSETYTLETASNRVVQYRWNATLGVHRIEVKVDPDNILVEFNRANNQVTYQFVVGSILSIRLPWNRGSVKINGTTYVANSSDTVEIPILPGRQTIELVGSRIVSPGKRLSFVRWNDGDTSNPRNFNATGDSILIPVYKTEFRLTIESNQGATTGDGWYDEGVTATAEATSPAMLAGGKTRLTFSQWSGDVISNKTRIDLRMDRPRNITVNWIREHYLTIVSSFSSTEKQGWYREGDRVTISATATLDQRNGTRRVFINWSGNTSSEKSQIEVTMNAPQILFAWYRTDYELMIASERGSSSGRRWVSAGEIVTLSVPREITDGDTRYVFMRWDGAIQSESNEVTFIVEAPKSVTATWKTQYRVTFTLAGVPNGTSATVRINGEEHSGSVPFSFPQWSDSGATLEFETAVNIETVTYDYSLEGWKDSVGNLVKSPHTLNGPIILRTIYVSRPKGLLNYLISAFGTDKLAEIVLLKNARDSVLGRSFAGKHLIYYFDLACHAIFPDLANRLTSNLALRTAFAVMVYPLMKTLTAPAILFELGIPMNELSFLLAGLMGAALAGMVYLSPIVLVLAYILRRRVPNFIIRTLKHVAIFWIIAVQMVIFGEIITSPMITAAATFIYLALTATSAAIIVAHVFVKTFFSSQGRQLIVPQWSAKSLLE